MGTVTIYHTVTIIKMSLIILYKFDHGSIILISLSEKRSIQLHVGLNLANL